MSQVDNTELITIYHYDSEGYLNNLTIAQKDTVLNTNETLIAPLDDNGLGMYKPQFVPAQNKWVETLSKEKIDEFNKIEKGKLSDQTVIAHLTAQLLQDSIALKQQGEQIASLTAALLAHTKAAK